MILVDSLKKWEILIKQLFCAMIFSVETPEQHAADSTGGEMKKHRALQRDDKERSEGNTD